MYLHRFAYYTCFKCIWTYICNLVSLLLYIWEQPSILNMGKEHLEKCQNKLYNLKILDMLI